MRDEQPSLTGVCDQTNNHPSIKTGITFIILFLTFSWCVLFTDVCQRVNTECDQTDRGYQLYHHQTPQITNPWSWWMIIGWLNYNIIHFRKKEGEREREKKRLITLSRLGVRVERLHSYETPAPCKLHHYTYLTEGVGLHSYETSPPHKLHNVTTIPYSFWESF